MAPRRAGFTLLELLVGLAVMGIALVYMLESVVFGNRTYTILDQVVETQQSLRAIANLLEHDLRHAGMMVPVGAAICGVDRTADPDLLFVSDADAIDPRDDIAPYDGSRITGGVSNVSGAVATLNLDSLVLEPAPPARPAYDIDGDGSNDSDFQVGGGVIIMDLEDPSRGTVCGRIRTVNVGGSSIVVDPVFTTAGLAATGNPTSLVAVPAHRYQIVNGDELERDGLLLSKGVEDLQLAYFLDANGNDQIDGGEMQGETSGDSFDARGTDISDLREIRMNLVVRTRGEDEAFDGRLQATENRAAGAADGFRRRVYTTTVLPRNLFERIGT